MSIAATAATATAAAATAATATAATATAATATAATATAATATAATATTAIATAAIATTATATAATATAMIATAITPGLCRETLRHLFHRRTDWLLRLVKSNPRIDGLVAEYPALFVLWGRLDRADRKWLVGNDAACNVVECITLQVLKKLDYERWLRVLFPDQIDTACRSEGVFDAFQTAKQDWFTFLVRLDDAALQRFLEL